MSWKKENIRKVIHEPISGEWGDEGDQVHVIRTTNFCNDGSLDLSELVTRNISISKVQKKKLLFGDTILEKSGGSPNQPVGRVVYFNVRENGKEYLCNNFTTIIRAQNNVDSKYLFWFLFQNHSSKQTLKYQNKTTGILNLKTERYLDDLEIPLPPLYTQQKIAAILDKADELRRKDKALLEKYDALLQSIFYKMFGDPVKNEKGWDVLSFAAVGRLDRGISKHRPRNAPELLGGKYPLIQTGDVANSEGYITTYKSTYSELGLKQSKLWQPGTLCITIAANIAKTGILTFEACFPDSVVGFLPNEKTNVEYIQWWLSHLQETLEATAPESAQKNINLDILRNLSLPVPPIEIQNKFKDIVNNIEQQKKQIRCQISNSEFLFQSLLQKAFKGELVH